MTFNEYVIKREGEMKEGANGYKRSDKTGKPRYDLLIPRKMKSPLLERWAVHMAKGAEIHGDRNWELASTQEDLETFEQGAFRHFVQWLRGETDEDHVAALMFNLQGAEYVKERLADKSMTLAEIQKRADGDVRAIYRKAFTP